ncbi:MAG: hypothetical protein DRR03_10645 [Gammaproteobacteria bacterium]|nr:MAG: hypothetical protein DRR03_10645 [Gammaproteobacteria bacterium]
MQSKRYYWAGIAGPLLVLLFSLPMVASAATLSGRLNGHDCAERGTACPIDRLDPHVTLEADFVLQQSNGEYFFLVNVPRDVKVRHVMEAIEVSGDLNRKYNAVTVDEFKVDGKVIWSQKLQEEEAQRHLWPGALTGQ